MIGACCWRAWTAYLASALVGAGFWAGHKAPRVRLSPPGLRAPARSVTGRLAGSPARARPLLPGAGGSRDTNRNSHARENRLSERGGRDPYGMTSMRAVAYRRVLKALCGIGAPELWPAERERVREAADALLFCR